MKPKSPELALAFFLSATVFLQAAQILAPTHSESSAGAQKPHPLVWDSMEKVFNPAPTDSKAEATFSVTNTGPVEVVISDIKPSCQCTTPHLPPMPWKLSPGSSGSFGASVDLHGKAGTIIKTLTVVSSAGFQVLTMRIDMPKDPVQAMAEREANMDRAKGDPQAVFKGNCAACHFNPLANKTDEELFVAGCAICHEPNRWAEARKENPDAHHRAEMVPDLAALSHPLRPALLKVVLMNGNGPGKLMPAFSQKHGGPLTDEQIDSLVDYCFKRFKSHPTNSEPTPVKAAVMASPAQALAIYGCALLAVAMGAMRKAINGSRWLQMTFGGLLFSATIGAALAFSTSLFAARLFGVLMLAGIGIMICGLHLRQKAKHNAPRQP